MSLSFADSSTVESALEIRTLVEALREGFSNGCEMPPRHSHVWERTTEPNAAFVLMPAWQKGGPMVVKLSSIVPGNSNRGIPSVMPIVLVFDAITGQPTTMMDGRAITLNRTAAASTLASTYLSRENSKRLVMLGTGDLAPYMVRAHCAVRPIEHVTIWGRDVANARKTADRLKGLNAETVVVEDAAEAVGQADIVSCATLATEAVVRGEWVSAGTHVDLVGSFQPHMREADDELMARSRIFADERGACLNEPGDIVLPIRVGAITEESVLGDLFGLARGQIKGRKTADEITVFKSVGVALEDMVAAQLVARKIN